MLYHLKDITGTVHLNLGQNVAEILSNLRILQRWPLGPRGTLLVHRSGDKAHTFVKKRV